MSAEARNDDAGRYAGSELDLFSGALNWKAYWSSLLRPLMGRRILDVGAGIGATARIFAGDHFEEYLALEPDGVLVSRMRDAAAHGDFSTGFSARQGTIETLAEGRAFDTIVYIDVLEHIEDDAAELTRAARRLLPGGRLIILSPAHQWLFTPFDARIGHFRRYNRKSLLAVRPTGLQLERIFYLDSVGLLASLGNRLLLRSSMPTRGQISLWDGWMVPASRILDRMTGRVLGKSIVAVFTKPGRPANGAGNEG
jgi:SAM-dependent methyltransferase